MKCYFCQYELGEPFYHGAPAPVMLTCENCPWFVKYYFGDKKIVYEYNFNTLLNGKLYELSFCPKNQPSFILYEAKGNLQFPVFKLNQLPNITPTNSKEKLKSYLVFS
jgi:hypothetical protein